MSVSRKAVFVAAGGLTGLVVIVAAALHFLIDAKAYKTRLEAVASQALGMDVSVDGRIGIAFFPSLRITLGDVRIHKRGADIATAPQVMLAIGLLPLLQGEVKIDQLALDRPSIAIRRERNGQFNYENVEADSTPVSALSGSNISLSEATLRYSDVRLGDEIEAHGCRLDVHDLRHAGGTRKSLLTTMSFAAKLDCESVRVEGLAVSGLKLNVDMKNGAFESSPFTARIFGTQGSGSVQANFSDEAPAYRVRFMLSQFPIEEVLKTVSPKNVAAGRMDFSADLSMRGVTRKSLLQTLKGQISLRGKHLTLNGSDLDRDFARFESSQNFNLVDVGAFLFAGPLGVVVTKGFDFANLIRGSGGSSEIQLLVSEWNVERGVAHARDVAMATKENRVAVTGGLDLVDDQFENVTFALLDGKGCARVRQRITGSFRSAVVERPSALAVFAGPALRLLKKGDELLRADDCVVFYAGTVAPPR